MKKVIVIFGTRPEAIKMCPVILELKKRKEFKTVVCVTGQHKEMLRQVLNKFRITEDYNLEVMKENQDLFDITESILRLIKTILINEKPNLILVHGDTTTTFASSLAGFYLRIPVGHVEAGLRTGNISSPFPEEFNRRVVSLYSKYNFAPTETAKQNLLAEGIEESKIFVTGNTGIDALKFTIQEGYTNELINWIGKDRMILVTAHRRENLGKPLENICNAINEISMRYNNVKFIYPVHMNPKVRKTVFSVLKDNPKVRIIEPLDVFDFHNLIANAYIIMTDSGGIQEEAPSLGKPVIVLRNETERPEGIKAGTLLVSGIEKKNIIDTFNLVYVNNDKYNKMSNAKNPFGDGNSSRIIAEIISQTL